MSTIIKNLIVTLFTVGLVFSEVSVNGELSSDVSYNSEAAEGESSLSFSSPYTGLTLRSEGWELSTHLSDNGVVIEEAKYSWSVTEKVSLTFGQQALPYGIAWGLHRPSNNSYVSLPREHSVAQGVGVSTSEWGVNAEAFYGNDEYWAGRLSYSIFDHSVGVSLNSDEALLVHANGKASVLGFPIETALEYDLSKSDSDTEEAGDGEEVVAEDDTSGNYWLRTVVTPPFGRGVSVLLGYNSDEEVTYGLRYNCSDRCFLSTELSSEGSKTLRVSYTF